MATAASEHVIERWRPRKRLWTLLALGVVGSTALGALNGWRDSHVFLINASDSLPNWAFLIRRGQAPDRGDYVFFDPPASALLLRHFGPRPEMFGKIVYGVAGDVVAHRGAIVTINGRAVARMKPLTKAGELLTPGFVGTIRSGCYYAGSPHRDGFDSRYAEIGLVCGRQIIGVGEPIL